MQLAGNEARIVRMGVDQMWVVITNAAGNVMFIGTKALFDACVERGQFEFEET